MHIKLSTVEFCSLFTLKQLSLSSVIMHFVVETEAHNSENLAVEIIKIFGLVVL